MTDNEKPESRVPGEDPWAIGQNADGTINVVPPGDLARRIAERDADSEEFGKMLDGKLGDETDDLSDLDDQALEDLLGAIGK